MLEARGLRKRYGHHLAVDSVSFEVRRGEILGYLGPNGSGKSTTVNMIAGLLEPSAGAISLDGCCIASSPLEYKRRLGFVPEEPFIYPHLTAPEYLRLVGGLRRIPRARLEQRIVRLLQLFSLYDSRYDAMSAYSKGMRQRVLLIAALLHDPDLLVLDEPLSGLDVGAALLVRALLRQLAEDGKMVLLSSHRFDVVDQVCSRVVILSHGRLVAERDVAQERSESLEELFVRVTDQQDYAAAAREVLGAVRQP
jgi:ABC-2 type transport system ATP-binding protein